VDEQQILYCYQAGAFQLAKLSTGGIVDGDDRAGHTITTLVITSGVRVLPVPRSAPA